MVSYYRERQRSLKMNIPKAIEILTYQVTDHQTPDPADHYIAMLMAIDSLRHIAQLRLLELYPIAELLRGETLP